MDAEHRHNWQGEKPWSDVDLFDLHNNVARGDLIEETADTLMRCEAEVRKKINELRNGRKRRR